MKFEPITRKAVRKFKGKVYDLMVDGDPSYNVSGIVVHNSGAGSLVNYALEITKIDPLKYDLLFERQQPVRKKAFVKLG